MSRPFLVGDTEVKHIFVVATQIFVEEHIILVNNTNLLQSGMYMSKKGWFQIVSKNMRQSVRNCHILSYPTMSWLVVISVGPALASTYIF